MQSGIFAKARALFCQLLLWCALAAPAAFADMYRVTVDTGALAGTTGYVDLQLNPADDSAPDANVTVSDLQGDLTLLAAAEVAGNVLGDLATTLTLSNGSAFNDYFQSVEFGDSFSFLLDITGDFLDEASSLGTSFALALYAADGVSPLLSSDASGSIVLFELADQAVTYQAFADENSNYAAQISPVPLPGALWLLLSGLLGVTRFVRRQSLR